MPEDTNGSKPTTVSDNMLLVPFDPADPNLGKVLHITVDDNIVLTTEEMQEVAQLFSKALEDPKGGIVVTIAGIHASYVK